jgi:hypothetical protein
MSNSVEDWFLNSSNPEDDWYAPSGLPILRLFDRYRSYCTSKETAVLPRRQFNEILLSMGAEQITSNYVYWILPERPSK